VIRFNFLIAPGHFTVHLSPRLQSWIVESSLDGDSWTEIDRQTDSAALSDDTSTVSFAVSNSDECRFIRLTQTGKASDTSDELLIEALEFFGTLLE
jgi:hypothetical protein